MADELIPADPAAAVTGFLTRIIAASTDPGTLPEDVVAFAVHEHATRLRAEDPAAVVPMMIADAQVLTRVIGALRSAATAAREELDAELDALGADPDTGRVDGQPVFVTGADGLRYKIARGHVSRTEFDDDLVAKLIAAVLRADYRAPEGVPGFLAAGYGDAFEAGVLAGVRQARAAIGRSKGEWLSTVLDKLAHRLGRAGDAASAGLLAAARRTWLERKDYARIDAAATKRTAA